MWFESSAFKKEMKNKKTEATVKRLRRSPGNYLEGKLGTPGKRLGDGFGYTFGIAAGFMYKAPTRLKGIAKIAASTIAGATVGLAMGALDLMEGALATAGGLAIGFFGGLFSEKARTASSNLIKGGVTKIVLGVTDPLTVTVAMASSGAYNLVMGKESTWSVMDKYNEIGRGAGEQIWKKSGLFDKSPEPKKEGYSYLADDDVSPFISKSQGRSVGKSTQKTSRDVLVSNDRYSANFSFSLTSKEKVKTR